MKNPSFLTKRLTSHNRPEKDLRQKKLMDVELQVTSEIEQKLISKHPESWLLSLSNEEVQWKLEFGKKCSNSDSKGLAHKHYNEPARVSSSGSAFLVVWKRKIFRILFITWLITWKPAENYGDRKRNSINCWSAGYWYKWLWSIQFGRHENPLVRASVQHQIFSQTKDGYTLFPDNLKIRWWVLKGTSFNWTRNKKGKTHP